MDVDLLVGGTKLLLFCRVVTPFEAVNHVAWASDCYTPLVFVAALWHRSISWARNVATCRSSGSV